MNELRKHLEDAIRINTTRLPLYASLTNEASTPFSKQLIRYEKWACLGSGLFDRKGNEWQEKGIPFIKAEFIDMSQTPEFQDTYPNHIAFAHGITILNTKAYRKSLGKALDHDGFEMVFHAAQQFLTLLNEQPAYYCMLRHLLESIRRIAFTTPLHQEKAHALGFSFPLRPARQLIKIHLTMLARAQTFDEDIAFIQQQGIPFIYQDLPHIGLDNPYGPPTINVGGLIPDDKCRRSNTRR